MEVQRKVIFDLDGTLYRLGGQRFGAFTASPFYEEIRSRIIPFVAAELRVDDEAARRITEKVDKQFDGELSIGLERAYGIDRYRFFESTWCCDPAEHIEPDPDLRRMLAHLCGEALLLTAAPRVWADKALGYLGLSGVFGESIITGEPDIRKPNPQVFLQAAEMLQTDPHRIISVGDQNYSDIVPAKSVGMSTVLIGPERLDADYRADDIYQALTLIQERIS